MGVIMKENLKKEKNVDLENINILMVQFMKEIFMIIIVMEKEYLFILMEKIIMVNGKIMFLMVMEFILGLME